MELQFVESFVKELEDLGSEIVQDLGVFGASLIASIRYDAEKAFDAAVQAGKFAKETFEEVGSKELADFWATAKAQIAQEAENLLTTFDTNGFHAAVAEAANLLDNINWRAVAVALTGIGRTTLEAAAGAFVRMLVSGVVVAG